jgi:phosphomannomutase
MFLDYDLRGLYPKELSPQLVKSVVFQFYQKSKDLSREAFLAIDTRESSLKIAHYIKSLLPDYFNYIGILPTPIFYWLVISKNIPGIMVTASHLPKKYNGLKFLFPGGMVWVPEVEKNFKREKWLSKRLEPLIKKEIYEEYFGLLKKLSNNENFQISLKKKHPFTKIFRKFFPLINIQIKKSPFLFDTDLDADRFYLYYRQKRILPDIVFTKIVLNSNYSKVAAPINMSQKLAKLVRKRAKLIFLPTGHKYFKDAFLKYKIEFAFEPSGHFYFFRDLKTESPFLALRKYLELFDEKDIELQNSLKISRVNFKLKKFIDLEKLSKHLIASLKPKKVKIFDGYLLQDKDFSCHLRLSRTELKLRVFSEGDLSKIKKYLDKIKEWLAKN